VTVFTEKEAAYLDEQKLCRIATVGTDGQPHVVPVTFTRNPDTDTIDVGGYNFANRKKWRDVGYNPKVTIVVDDVQPPWKPRGIEIRARAERLTRGGSHAIPGDTSGDEQFRLYPHRVISWGVEAESFSEGATYARDTTPSRTAAHDFPTTAEL
jgi:pyridoxamine 5'-phosphate oxidase family protein